jgi:hypothetical protein
VALPHFVVRREEANGDEDRGDDTDYYHGVADAAIVEGLVVGQLGVSWDARARGSRGLKRLEMGREKGLGGVHERRTLNWNFCTAKFRGYISDE